MGNLKELTKGLIKENPTLVGLLGMCPTLAVTCLLYTSPSPRDRG